MRDVVTPRKRDGHREEAAYAHPLATELQRGGLSQRLNRLEFVVCIDGTSLFPHRGE